MKIDYVVVSCTNNSLYFNFLNLIKEYIPKIMKTKLICVFVGDKNKITKFENGIIHEIKQIENIPCNLQAAISRMYITKFYSNSICMISDIDMLILNKDYFNDTIISLDEDSLVIFGHDLYPNTIRYPMCYNIAKGKIFEKILKIQDITFECYCNMLYEKYKHLGSDRITSADELYYTDCVNESNDVNVVKIERGLSSSGIASNRIDRIKWEYDDKKITQYIDCHMLRPYESTNKEKIDKLLTLLSSIHG